MAVATVIVISCRQFSPILQSRQSSPKRVHSVLFILLLLVLTSAFTSSCDPHILTVTRPAPLLTHVLTPFGQKMSEKMSGKTTVTVYDGFVYHPPPWGGFPRSIARQPTGCQYRTIRLPKALDEMFLTPTFLAPTLYSDHGIVGPETGAIYTVVSIRYSIQIGHAKRSVRRLL